MERAITPDYANFEAPELVLRTLPVPADVSGGRPVAIRRTSLEGGDQTGWNNPDGVTIIGVNPLLARAHDWDYTAKRFHHEAKQELGLDTSFVSIYHPHCAKLDDCAAMTVDTAHFVKDRVADGHRVFLLETSKGGLDGGRASHAMRGLNILAGQASFGTPYTGEQLIPELLMSFPSEIKGSIEKLAGPERRPFAKLVGSASLYAAYLMARHPRSFHGMVEDLIDNAKPDDLVAASSLPQTAKGPAPIPSFTFHYESDGVVNARHNVRTLESAGFEGQMSLIKGIHIALLTDRASRRAAMNCLLSVPEPARPPQTHIRPLPLEAA